MGSSPRFFVFGNKFKKGESVFLEEDDAHHAFRVLRLKKHDIVEICDGDETVFKSVINEINKKFTEVILKELIKEKTEPPYKITLIQGILKGRKMDTVIQHAIELGVWRIIPLITERTVPIIKDFDRGNAKVERWQKIALAAASQSRRGIVPSVEAPCLLKDLFQKYDLNKSLTIIFWEEEKRSGIPVDKCREFLNRTGSFNVVVGPEGGFDLKDMDHFKDNSVITAGLGPRVLRAETAATAALILSQTILGDLQGDL